MDGPHEPDCEHEHVHPLPLPLVVVPVDVVGEQVDLGRWGVKMKTNGWSKVRVEVKLTAPKTRKPIT